MEKKSWKTIHKETKETKKKYREENVLRKLEKQKKNQTKSELKNETRDLKPLTPASTISIAIPGSILENAQSPELRTYLAGQIARAACIFCVDEVIVFDDIGLSLPEKGNKSGGGGGSAGGDENCPTIRHCCLQLARILQYLECPQYLRKFFFPIHKDLKFSGLLNPLDAPHHLRQQNDFIFREGVVTSKPAKESKGSYVNIGLLNDCLVDKILTPGIRVTVKLHPNQDLKSRKINANVVAPSQPRTETGVYWGYTVRVASSLSDIFTKSPYTNGYDLTIGTSDKGDNVHDVKNGSLNYNHALIVYGGLQGLESALENDDKLNVDNPSLLFDQYINIIPNQGSRTIRTEEAVLISLAALEDKLKPIEKSKIFNFSTSIAQSEDTGMKQQINNNTVGNTNLKRKLGQNEGNSDNEVVKITCAPTNLDRFD